MSDFLGDLVSKSLGLTPIIQPQPLSRFEPWRSDGTFGAVHHDFDAALDAERASERLQTDLPVLRREQDIAAQARSDWTAREPQGGIGERVYAQALHPSSPPEPKSALALPTVLAPAPVTTQPVMRERDVSNENLLPSLSDPSRNPRDGINDTAGAQALHPMSPPAPKPALTLQTVLPPAPVTTQPAPRERDVSNEMPLPSSSGPPHERREPIVESLYSPAPRERDVSNEMPLPSSSGPPHERRRPMTESLYSPASKPALAPREPDASNEMLLSWPADRTVKLQNDAMFTEAHAPTVRPIVERVEHFVGEHEHLARDREPPVAATVAAPEPMATAPKIELQPVVTSWVAEPVIMERRSSGHAPGAPPSVSQSYAAPVPASNASDAKSVPRPAITSVIERVERRLENPDRNPVARREPAWTLQPLITPSRATTDSQPSAPTIRVTIGRIEVRATPPAAPAKRASQPAPKMSLEEYLRSRSGDRR